VLVSWVTEVDGAFTRDDPFGPQTLPYGVIEDADGRHVAVRLGDHALPLRGVAQLGERVLSLVSGDSLDPLLAAGRTAWSELRAELRDLVDRRAIPKGARLVPLDEVRAVLPFTVRDFVDFYSSRHHAENLGRLFRPDAEPLLPNWVHLPVAYHGRAGTVVVSGTDVVRPAGQWLRDGKPVFGPTERLDIEAEVGFVCGGAIQSRVPVSRAGEHLFGVVLVNDWSARDIQAWEYQPLGPFLGKSFATSVSAWITPLEALAKARTPVPKPSVPLLPYLVEDSPGGYHITSQVRWNGTVVTTPPYAGVSWSSAQQLAHLTVNGATVRPGDLFASGTVSGPKPSQVGSFLELTAGGPVTLDDGSRRTFLADGDTVVITGSAPGPDGSVVGVSEVRGTVLGSAP
jgi:fumarylacetoacetase